MTTRIRRLENPVRHYDWGSRTAIPELLGRATPADEAWAELWIGAHPSAPSRIEADSGAEPLDAFIARDAAGVLGAETAARFGGKLPFLLKLLAAEQPLSLQAHPDAEQARAGFARENALGLAPDAPDRCYRDDRPKPELILALSRFRALNRFLEPVEVAERFDSLAAPELAEALTALRARPDSRGLAAFFELLWTLPDGEIARVLAAASAWAQREAGRDPAARCLLELADRYPGDPGVLAPLLLQLVELEPGEAIFLPPGQLHAYLEGTAVEIMGSSDNVLRGGLTSKHVDVEGLIRTLTFRSGPVEVLRPRLESGLFRYPTPAPEFALDRIEVVPGQDFRASPQREVEILLCTRGLGRLDTQAVSPGDAWLVPASADPYRLEGDLEMVRAAPGSPETG